MTADQTAASRPVRDDWAVPPVPILSRTAHDRIADRRTDERWNERAWSQPTTRVLLLSPNGTAQVRFAGPDEPDLVYRAPAEVDQAGIRVLLGQAGDTVYYAVLAIQELPEYAEDDWRGLRELGTTLTNLDVGLLTAAVALQAWHRRHRHCPICGALTEPAQSGWTRKCPVDGSEHFPRTDPAVIMLVHDGAGRCVLARGPLWPPGRMSVLAGFVEAGESAESAVVREVTEEVGIAITDVRYVDSQPHPFPASLMLGFTARLDGDPTLRIDHDEIIEAGWFTRDEVRQATDWDGTPDVDDPDALVGLRGLPGAISIARQLINEWLLATD